MQVGIMTSFSAGMGFRQALPLIHAAGFRQISLGGKPDLSGYANPEDLKELEAMLEKLELRIDSLHAPFPEGDQLFSLEEDARQASLRLCRLSIEAASRLDGRAVVLHLIPYGVAPGETRQRMIAKGRDSVSQLMDYAAPRGVKLALENGQRDDYDEVLFQLLDEFPPEQVGLCYDSGHENVRGCCFELLERYAARLICFHVHDNLGSDAHLLPFEGNIDWSKFNAILKREQFDCALMLEPGMAGTQFTDPVEFLDVAINRAEKVLLA